MDDAVDLDSHLEMDMFNAVFSREELTYYQNVSIIIKIYFPLRETWVQKA